jgi:hypothetical protein
VEQQEIKQLCDKMAELEKETRQTTELMQAARKQLTGDADLEYGACEVVRTYAWDSTGEDAVACGSGGRWYEDLGMYVCDHCIDKDRQSMNGDIKKCATEMCFNNVQTPNVYCGRCGGYEHEMSPFDRKRLLVMPRPRVTRIVMKSGAR